MLTEDDAKTKWSPFARVALGWAEGVQAVGAAVNRSPDWHPLATQSNCIGSACMAWRWNMEWESATEEGHGGDLVVRLKRRRGDPKTGYCGLAGGVEIA